MGLGTEAERVANATYNRKYIMKSRWIFLSFPLLASLLAIPLAAPQEQAKANASPKNQPSEFQRRTMELLTPEQKAHQRNAPNLDRQRWIEDHPARESTGPIPLTELKGTYKGEEGGLYRAERIHRPENTCARAWTGLARSRFWMPTGSRRL